MTKEEFEQGYAERSGKTVEAIKTIYGLEAIPCDCGEEICQGWQMISKNMRKWLLEEEE